MTARPLSAIVLAAGEGTRMRSTRPKPLHVLCGRPMLLYVLDALVDVDLERAVVVVGHGAEQVTKRLHGDGPDLFTTFVEQEVQRGTGDAVLVGLTGLPDDALVDDAPADDDHEGDVLVLPGDTPLLQPGTIARLVDAHRAADAACTLLTSELSDPAGYGRVVRGRDDRVERIVEESDANTAQKAITEVNTSIYCFRRSLLAPALRRTSPENAQGEYYLTDVVEVLHDAGYPVQAVVTDEAAETQGVNDRQQLAGAEAALRQRTAQRWMRQGVTMVDPARTYLDTTVDLGTDVTLFPGTILSGRTVVGAGSEIGPDTRLTDCVVGAGTSVEQTVGIDAEIGEDAVVGPFAYLPAGSTVADGARTGPFHTPPTISDPPDPDEAGAP